MFALSDARELSSLQVLYRKIPKISPSMCPQNRNAKTSPPNISPWGGGGGLYLEFALEYKVYKQSKNGKFPSHCKLRQSILKRKFPSVHKPLKKGL